MIATLLRLAGINANVKYEICSWQSGQKNTSWIGPGGGEHIYIYIHNIYIYIYIIYIYSILYCTTILPNILPGYMDCTKPFHNRVDSQGQGVKEKDTVSVPWSETIQPFLKHGGTWRNYPPGN